jgi:hypothetical protein
MSGWNLPPGCSLSDIPGNRPEDIAHEKMCDEIETALNPLKPFWSDESVETVTKNIIELINKAFEQGYQQSTNDAKEAQFYKDNEPNWSE